MAVSEGGTVVGIAMGELLRELVGLGVESEVVGRQVGVLMGGTYGVEVGQHIGGQKVDEFAVSAKLVLFLVLSVPG